jgi:hypothetical protein
MYICSRKRWKSLRPTGRRVDEVSNEAARNPPKRERWLQVWCAVTRPTAPADPSLVGVCWLCQSPIAGEGMLRRSHLAAVVDTRYVQVLRRQ